MSDAPTSPTGARPAKRYIATHDPVTGKCIYADAPEHVFAEFPGFGFVARSYATGSLPARLNNDEDVRAFKSTDTATSYARPKDFGMPAPIGEHDTALTPGFNLNVLELIPGADGHWHRTMTLDISICLLGEVDHELDGGETVRLYPGDHIIQRATLHRWSNPSKYQPARVIAAILPCEPFEVAGKSVQENHIPFGQDIPE